MAFADGEIPPLPIGFIRHEDLLDNMLKVAGSETDVYGYDFIDNDTNPLYNSLGIQYLIRTCCLL
jgi:hypothetical protein